MQNKNNQLALIAVMSALALLGVVVVLAITTVPTMQEAEARGCKHSVAANASKGRCFHPD